jgi:protein SCO1/2
MAVAVTLGWRRAIPFGCLLALLSAATAASATEHEPSAGWDPDKALAYSQAAIGRQVSDHQFTAADGTSVALRQFAGKPVVVSLIYTSCYHVCPTLTEKLAAAVRVANEAMGTDSYQTLTVGFDSPVDTSENMRQFAEQRGINVANWLFLSAPQDTIDQLAKELGFIFFQSPKGFDHLTQTTILDGESKVYKQIYGVDLSPPILVEPLKSLALGKPAEGIDLSQWVARIRLFCTVYDPRSGRYRFDYSLVIAALVGFLCLGSIAWFLIRAWRQHPPSGA